MRRRGSYLSGVRVPRPMPVPVSTHYCPWDGRRLDRIGAFDRYWAELYKCPVCRRSFTTVASMRSVYPPLIPVHDRRAEKALLGASEGALAEAFSAVRRIDATTVSTQRFEGVLVRQFHARSLEAPTLAYRLETGAGQRDRLVGAWGDRRFAVEIDRARAWAPHARFPTEAEWDRTAPEWAQGLWHEATSAEYDEGEGPIEMRPEKGAPVTFW